MSRAYAAVRNAAVSSKGRVGFYLRFGNRDRATLDVYAAPLGGAADAGRVADVIPCMAAVAAQHRIG